MLTGRQVAHEDGLAETSGFVFFIGTTPCGTGTVTFHAVNQTVAGVGTGHATTVRQAGKTVDIYTNAELGLAGLAFTYSGTYHCG
jgi:hypothetical protein